MDIVASVLELVSGFYFCICYCDDAAGNLRWIIFPDIILESVLALSFEVLFPKCFAIMIVLESDAVKSSYMS